MLNKLRLRLRALFFKSKMEDELQAELQFHLEREIEKNIVRGMTPEEARSAAIRSFGGVERVKEESRDVRGVRLVEDLLQDLRHGMRLLLKNPGFTTIAVLTLALGIGANTAIFTLANSLLFRLPAVKQPNQLVTPNGGRSNNGTFSYRDFQDYQQRNQSFERMTAFITDPVNVGLGQQNEMAAAEYVSANFFTVLGVDAARGRVFKAEDGQATEIPPVAVISASLWWRLGADADIIGRTIAVNQGRYTVIGVAAEGFKGVTGVLQADVWIMLEQAGQHIDGFAQRLVDREVMSYQILARLKPGVSLQQAQAELQIIDQALDREFPRTAQTGADQQRLRPLSLERVAGAAAPGLKQQVAPVALLLLAVVGAILLLACANVANLLLARASARQREIAVRLSLGASRFRLIRQLMTESALLAALGAIAGMLFSIWVTRLMTASLPSFAGLRISIEPAVDGRVFGFTVAVAILSALLFGLLPAFQSTKPDPIATLKTGAETTSSSNPFHRRFSLRNILVVAQFSLSLLLLLAAGLFVRSLQNASYINPGFKLEGRLAMWVNPTPQKQTPAYTAEFYQHALERVRALPGVRTVGLIDYLPISLVTPKRCYAAAGQATMDARQQPQGGYSVIAPDYFAAIGIPLRHGRDFSLSDTPQTPGVVIVNETLARRLWPNTDPLGQQLRTGEGCSQTLTVVGLAADSQYTNLGEAPQPHLYIPFTQQPEPWGWRHLVIHAPGAGESLLQTVSRELQALSPDVVIREAQPLARHIDLSLWPARAGAATLGGFGLLALLLAWVGIYGVMSYVVSRRTQEIGLRIALGAKKQDVLRMVLGDGLVLIVTGAVIGLSLAFAATRFLKGFLYGVSATDPLTFSVILLLLTIVALVACWMPARRAMKVDPVVALRCE